METDSFILVGKVQKPHGRKGELIVHWLHPGIIPDKPLRKLWLGDDPDHLNDWDIVGLKSISDHAILQLKKVNSREQAEYLQGIGIYMPIDFNQRTASLAVEGFQVVDHRNGKILGTIESIDMQSPQLRYLVRTGQGQYSVPAVPEMIARVDREMRQIRIHHIEGLLPE